YRFAMFFGMFVITGVNWILEIIAYLFAISNEGFEDFSDLITCSQGILLFFVTIWKKEVLKALYER
ncbi:hypothetical protein KR222_001105, partial [Zaprionus bogoriensis]